MQKKKTLWQEQLAQLCSQIMFFFFCVYLFFASFAENTIKIGMTTPQKNKKNNKINKFYKLKIGPSIS